MGKVIWNKKKVCWLLVSVFLLAVVDLAVQASSTAGNWNWNYTIV